MNKLLSLVRGEPVAISGVTTAAISLAVILGANEKAMGGIGVLLGAIISLIVRSQVTPVTTAVATVTKAATDAATQVAANLDQTTSGAVGTITDTAQAVVKSAVAIATDTHLKDAGLVSGSHAS